MPANPNGTTPNRYLRGRVGVKAAERIYEGNLVMVGTSTGYAQTGAAATAAMRCIGWAIEEADNTSGSAGDIAVAVSKEARGFYGKSGDAPTAANIGATVYIHDGVTIKVTADGSNPVTAGVLLSIVGSVYYVQFA